MSAEAAAFICCCLWSTFAMFSVSRALEFSGRTLKFCKSLAAWQGKKKSKFLEAYPMA